MNFKPASLFKIINVIGGVILAINSLKFIESILLSEGLQNRVYLSLSLLKSSNNSSPTSLLPIATEIDKNLKQSKEHDSNKNNFLIQAAIGAALVSLRVGENNS